MRVLLALGACVIPDSAGATPLHLACKPWKGQEGCIAALLDAEGVELSATDRRGQVGSLCGVRVCCGKPCCLWGALGRKTTLHAAGIRRVCRNVQSCELFCGTVASRLIAGRWPSPAGPPALCCPLWQQPCHPRTAG